MLCVLARFYIFFSRKGAKIAKNFSVVFVLIPNTFTYFVPRRGLTIDSLAEAQSPQRISMFCSYPKHLCVLCVLTRFYISFLSQRRQDRQELICLICSYPRNLCVLCASARLYLFFSLAEAQRPQRNTKFILFSHKTPLRALRLGES